MEYLLNIEQGILLAIILVLGLIAAAFIITSTKKSDTIIAQEKQVTHFKRKNLTQSEDYGKLERRLRSSIMEKEGTIVNIKDNMETISHSRKALREDIKAKDTQIKNLRNTNKQYEGIIDSVEDNILTYLRFIMPDGEVANNVKVKTVVEGDKVVRLEATIRRKVEGEYKAVSVATVLTRPTES